MLPGWTQHQVKLAEALILQAKIVLEIDRRSDDAERFARDAHVRGRRPEAGRPFDVKLLAGRRVVQRARRKLSRNRRGDQQKRRGKESVQANSKPGDHEWLLSPETKNGRWRKVL